MKFSVRIYQVTCNRIHFPIPDNNPFQFQRVVMGMNEMKPEGGKNWVWEVLFTNLLNAVCLADNIWGL